MPKTFIAVMMTIDWCLIMLLSRVPETIENSEVINTLLGTEFIQGFLRFLDWMFSIFDMEFSATRSQPSGSSLSDPIRKTFHRP